MHKNDIEDDWSDKKRQFRTGLLGAILMSFLFLIFPGYKGVNLEKKFSQEKKILSELPIFKKSQHGKGKTNYYVELHFIEDSNVYRIEDINYNFLKHHEFIENIKSGDTITIKRHQLSIHSFVKNGKDYLNYRKAENNRANVIKALGLLFLPQIIICIFALLQKKHPEFSYNGKRHKINFPLIVIGVFIITFLILIFNIDFHIITNGKFVDY